MNKTVREELYILWKDTSTLFKQPENYLALRERYWDWRWSLSQKIGESFNYFSWFLPTDDIKWGRVFVVNFSLWILMPPLGASRQQIELSDGCPNRSSRQFGVVLSEWKFALVSSLSSRAKTNSQLCMPLHTFVSSQYVLCDNILRSSSESWWGNIKSRVQGLPTNWVQF